jgi:hypothetical protein
MPLGITVVLKEAAGNQGMIALQRGGVSRSSRGVGRRRSSWSAGKGTVWPSRRRAVPDLRQQVAAQVQLGDARRAVPQLDLVGDGAVVKTGQPHLRGRIAQHIGVTADHLAQQGPGPGADRLRADRAGGCPGPGSPGSDLAAVPGGPRPGVAGRALQRRRHPGGGARASPIATHLRALCRPWGGGGDFGRPRRCPGHPSGPHPRCLGAFLRFEGLHAPDAGAERRRAERSPCAPAQHLSHRHGRCDPGPWGARSTNSSGMR